jgi:hypothetical protein
MQAELIQEVSFEGHTVFYTAINGNYVANSLSSKFEEAERLFHHILKHGSLDPTKTVLRIASVRTDSAETVEP